PQAKGVACAGPGGRGGTPPVRSPPRIPYGGRGTSGDAENPTSRGGGPVFACHRFGTAGVLIMRVTGSATERRGMERPPPVPPGTGPLSPDFSGMNPALMAEFIALLEQAHAVLREETGAILAERSEERRVGKEGRSRWGRCQAERPRGPQTAAVRKRRTLPAP